MSTPETSSSGWKPRAYEGVQSAGIRISEALVPIVLDEIEQFVLDVIDRLRDRR